MDTTETTMLGNLQEDISYYLGTSLADFYSLSSHRLMVYAISFILVGVGSYGAMTLYDLGNELVSIKLTFKGVYAWHTAINFAICLLVVDSLAALLIRPWGAFDRRTVGKAWLIFLVAYLVGLLTQRTLVYQLTRLYEPSLVWVFSINPSQRPEVFGMFLFLLPFWLVIATVLMRIITSKQAQTEELLRVRIDAILEERARQVKSCDGAVDASAAGPARADQDLRLPTDPGVGPIRASQIGHITVEDHYLRIFYLREDRDLHNTLIRMPLREVATRLPGDQFVQIHRSHMVRLENISGLKRSGRTVRLTMKHGDFELPVSRYRLPQLLPVLEKFLNPC